MAEEGSRERLLDDVEFVEGPAEDWECPICKQTLLDPHLLGCCGNHFCESCVKRLEARPCPLCGGAITALLDKRRQREVWQGKVRCPNGGCDWQGELRHLTAHLEGDQSRGRPPLCQLEIVVCGNDGCTLRLPRRDMEPHQRDECPHRRVLCQYCRSVETTHQDMVGVHWSQCPDFPVSCPNNCGVAAMARSRVQSHCDRECRLQLVRCPYAEVGCRLSRPRKDLQAHVRASELHHGELLVRKTVELQESVVAKVAEEMKKMTVVMQEQLAQRDEVIRRLDKEALERKAEFERFVEDGKERIAARALEFKAQLEEKDAKILLLEEKLQENSKLVEAGVEERLGVLERMAELEEREREREQKMEAQLVEVKEIRRSKSDVGKVEEDLTKVAKQVDALEETVAAAAVSTATSREKEVESLKRELMEGVEQVARGELEEGLTAAREVQQAEQEEERRERKAAEEKMAEGLAEDRTEIGELKVKVAGVEREMGERVREEVERVREEFRERIDRVITEMEYIENVVTPTSPFSFTISRFTRRREKKEPFVSDPFYTSRRGYRMVVRVDTAGTDTHISVWCCITRGQHDHILPWPLRADIFVRLVNPRDKDKFYERQICYDHQTQLKHAGRVVTGDKNYLWGLREFVTLKEVYSGQFLAGDALDFVVHRVELKEMDRPIG